MACGTLTSFQLHSPFSRHCPPFTLRLRFTGGAGPGQTGLHVPTWERLGKGAFPATREPSSTGKGDMAIGMRLTAAPRAPCEGLAPQCVLKRLGHWCPSQGGWSGQAPHGNPVWSGHQGTQLLSKRGDGLDPGVQDFPLGLFNTV